MTQKFAKVKAFTCDHSDAIVTQILTCCSQYTSDWATPLSKLPGFIVFSQHLNELVNNSLDSIAERRLSDKDFTEANIEIIIKNNDSSITLKIRDNGVGLGKDYVTKLRYLEFEQKRSHLHFHKDKKTYCVGGNGIGLFNLHRKLASTSSELFLKSRKKHGASIEIVMRSNHELGLAL